MQDLFEYEPLSSQEALAVDEYAEEIHQHLRQAEVCISCDALK